MIKLLNTAEELLNFRNKEYLDFECSGCKMTFSRTKWEYKLHLKKGCKNIYCSNDCQVIFTKKTLRETNCRFCNTKILKRQKEIDKKWPNLFCNSSCFAKWNNKNKKLNKQ